MTDDCFDKFIELAPGSKAEAARFVESLKEKVAERAKDRPDISEGTHLRDVLEQEAEELKRETLRNKMGMLAALEARRRQTLVFRENLDNPGFSVSKAYIKTLEDAAQKVSGAQKTVSLRFGYDIEAAGLKRYLSDLEKSPAEQQNVVTELYEASKSDGNPGSSGSENARKFVEIYTTHKKAIDARGEKAGVGARTLEGHILEQIWSPDALRAFTSGSKDPAGTFAEAVFPHVDRARTLGDAAASDGKTRVFLREFYASRMNEDIQADVPVSLRNLDNQSRSTFRKKRMQSRELHAKSPGSFKFLFDSFNSDTLASALQRSLEMRVRGVTAAEELGPNARNTVEFLRNEVLKEAKARKDPDPLGGRGSLKDARINMAEAGFFNIIDGGDIIDASSPDLAKFGAAMRNTFRAVNLGTVVLYTPTEFVTLTRAESGLYRGLAKANVEVARGAAARARGLLEVTNPETFRLLSTAINVSHAYSVGRDLQRSSKNTLSGRAMNISGGLVDLTFSFQGMNYVTRKFKTRAAITLNVAVAQLRNKSFSQMDGSLRELLLAGGMTSKDWDTMRAMDSVFSDLKDGNTPYIDMGALRRENEQLANTFDHVLRQFADLAVLTPGAFERSVLTLGLRPGTFSGELVRMVTDLLGWPLTFVTKALSREIRMNGMRGFTVLGVEMLAAGAVSTVLKDLVVGQTRDYFTDDVEEQTRLLKEYAVRGGLGGLYGDLVAKAIDPRFGTGPLESAASAPVFGGLDSLAIGGFDIMQAAADGDPTDAAFKAVKTVKGFVPLTDTPLTAFLSQQIVDEIGYALGGEAERSVEAAKARARSQGKKPLDIQFGTE